MHSIHRGWAAAAAVAAVIPATLAMAATSPAQPIARAARTCGLAGEWASLGPTYVETLNVSGTSCGRGANVIKAYNHCRLSAGGAKGRCHARVLGSRCSETRSTGPVQFVASVRCTKGRTVVKFAYSENF
jgi:hypothetical protein